MAQLVALTQDNRLHVFDTYKYRKSPIKRLPDSMGTPMSLDFAISPKNRVHALYKSGDNSSYYMYLINANTGNYTKLFTFDVLDNQLRFFHHLNITGQKLFIVAGSYVIEVIKYYAKSKDKYKVLNKYTFSQPIHDITFDKEFIYVTCTNSKLIQRYPLFENDKTLTFEGFDATISAMAASDTILPGLLSANLFCLNDRYINILDKDTGIHLNKITLPVFSGVERFFSIYNKGDKIIVDCGPSLIILDKKKDFSQIQYTRTAVREAAGWMDYAGDTLFMINVGGRFEMIDTRNWAVKYFETFLPSYDTSLVGTCII